MINLRKLQLALLKAGFTAAEALDLGEEEALGFIEAYASLHRPGESTENEKRFVSVRRKRTA